LKGTGVASGAPAARRRSHRDAAAGGRSGSASKPHRIAPADEELSDELLHIFHNPIQGWWSNRWVVDLADEGAPDDERSPRTP